MKRLRSWAIALLVMAGLLGVSAAMAGGGEVQGTTTCEGTQSICGMDLDVTGLLLGGLAVVSGAAGLVVLFVSRT